MSQAVGTRTSGTGPGARIGYTRVSTVSQTLDQQNNALTTVGVSKVFSDTMSGARDDRPGLAALMEYVREGDTLTCGAKMPICESNCKTWSVKIAHIARVTAARSQPSRPGTCARPPSTATRTVARHPAWGGGPAAHSPHRRNRGC
jgi:hypothetical protein